MSRLDIHAMRREQILDAMEPLVARQGWEHTTFAEICRAAGVSNRVLTYHFKDKNDLLLAVFERAVQRFRENLEPGLPEECTIEEKLAYIMCNEAARQGRTQMTLLFLHLMAQAAVNPDMAARLKELFRDARGRLATTLARDSAAGRIRVDDPEIAATLIQTLILGSMFGRATLGIEIPPEHAYAMVLTYLRSDPTPHTVNGAAPHDANHPAETPERQPAPLAH